MNYKKVVVAGGGVLGSQIAFQAAYCGFDVTIWLRSEGSVKRCLPKLEALKRDYINDINTRLSFYKRLTACNTPEEFEDLKVELIDRFGFLPPETVNLFELSALKRLATDLGIKRITGDGKGGIIEFTQDHKVDNAYLIQLMTNCKHNEYRLTPQSGLRYNLPETDKFPRLKLLSQLLRAMAAHSTLAS